ncbi:MAG: hypothetical protein Q9181_002003 [Wetmoreana brouardii]
MSGTRDATERSPLLAERNKRTASHVIERESESQSESNAESGQQTPQVESAEQLQSRKNVKRMLPVLGTGIFLAFLDQSIVAAINGDIGSDLGALRSVSWIATAYFLTMTCSQPLYGKLSDVFGRKPCLLFAYTMFGIGSLGCGITGTMAGLIAARAVQGIGGGGMLIVVTVLFSDYIPLRERGTYQGYLNLIGAIGSTTGGPIVFLCLVATISIGFLLHLPHRKSEVSWREHLKRIDFLGAFLLILIVFGLLFGLDRGTSISWRNPVTLTSLCATVPLLLAFLWVETRFASEPFTPGHVIFDKGLFACYVQNFFGYAGFTALIFYLPLFSQVALKMTPAQAGAGLIPAAISGVVGTLLGGIILKRIGRFYWLALIAASVGALAAIPIALAPSLKHGSLITICIGSVASFVPQGITVTASLIAIISNVSAADQAVATACSFLFRSLGAAVGVSLVGLVIRHVMGIKLRASLDSHEADQILRKIARSLEFIRELRPELQALVRECYSAGIQSGYIMSVALLGVAAFSYVGNSRPVITEYQSALSRTHKPTIEDNGTIIIQQQKSLFLSISKLVDGRDVGLELGGSDKDNIIGIGRIEEEELGNDADKVYLELEEDCDVEEVVLVNDEEDVRVVDDTAEVLLDNEEVVGRPRIDRISISK